MYNGTSMATPQASGASALLTVKAPVDTALSEHLRTPNVGTGIYDREGGLKAGQKKTYEVTITRTTGPAAPVAHVLRLKNNKSDTFSIVGPTTVLLPLNQPVTVKVEAAPTAAGIKSARLEVDDPTTVGVDRQIMATVVVANPVEYSFSASDSVQRNSSRSYFVTVPEGARTLEVALDGVKDGGWTFADAVHPYGTLTKDDDPSTPEVAAYPNPKAGVWEITVQSYYGSELLDSPYDLHVTVYGTAFDPEPATVPEAKSGTPAAVSWTATNKNAPVEGTLKTGPLGSSRSAHPTIGDGETQSYTVEVYGYSVPSDAGATYDYRDVFYAGALGSVTLVDAPAEVKLGTGASTTVTANVTALTGVPEGRDLLGEVRLVNTRGTVTGVGTVRIGEVVS